MEKTFTSNVSIKHDTKSTTKQFVTGLEIMTSQMRRTKKLRHFWKKNLKVSNCLGAKLRVHCDLSSQNNGDQNGFFEDRKCSFFKEFGLS